MEVHGGTYTNFKAAYNQGKGIHFDSDNLDITVTAPVLADNLESGAQIEDNLGPFAFTNAQICNNNKLQQAFQGGLSLVNSEYVSFTGSTFYNNGVAQILLAGNNGGLQIKNWQTGATAQTYNQDFTVDSTTIEATGSQETFRDSFLSQDWSRFTNSLTSDYNTWWNGSSSSPFTVPNKSANQTFSQWKSDTGKDAHSAFSTASASCSVTPQSDFWLIAPSSSNSVSPGSRSSFTLDAFSLGFSGELTLKADASGVPSGSASLSATSISSTGSTTLTVSTSSSTPKGTYPVTVVANSGNVTHTVTVGLVVN